MTHQKPWGCITGVRPVKMFCDMLDSGLSDHQARLAFAEKYGARADKIELASCISKIEREIAAKTRPHDVSLYVGIPFCPTKCAYCSFVSHAIKFAGVLIEPYLLCLVREMQHCADIIKNAGLRLVTVYVGGGTPTVLSAAQLDYLLGSIARAFDMSSVREYSVEAGRADTITRDKLNVLAEHGVNRISINPQTLHDDTLKAIGRNHTVGEFYTAMDEAKKVGFKNINADLIAGLPNETLEMFQMSLKGVIETGASNITVHTLALKRGSILAERGHEFTLSEHSIAEDMLQHAYEVTQTYEFAPYYLYRQKNMLGGLENVGFSREGCVCEYNIFTMQEIQTILAVGAGGVTKICDPQTKNISRIFNVKEPKDYILRIDEMLSRKDDVAANF